LIEEIDDELKDAMRARDAERRDTLRLILNALKNSEKELQRPLSEEEELQVLQRERKRRVEAAEAFRTGGREEQAEAEERELDVLARSSCGAALEDEIDEIVLMTSSPRWGARAWPTSGRDGRRDAADRRPRRRLTGEPDRARKSWLSASTGIAAGAVVAAEARDAVDADDGAGVRGVDRTGRRRGRSRRDRGR
jgi:uncharacterized protein YqeY